MVVAVLLISVLSGMAGVGIILYWELGWIIAFGAYVLGGMIGSAVSIAIAVVRCDGVNSQTNTPESEINVTEYGANTSFPPCQPSDRIG